MLIVVGIALLCNSISLFLISCDQRKLEKEIKELKERMNKNV